MVFTAEAAGLSTGFDLAVIGRLQVPVPFTSFFVLADVQNIKSFVHYASPEVVFHTELLADDSCGNSGSFQSVLPQRNAHT